MRRAAGLPELRGHDLRRSAASVTVAVGVDLDAVSKVLKYARVASAVGCSHIASDTLLKAVEPAVGVGNYHLHPVEPRQVRAVTVALVDWVASGREPPPSAYPRLADGTLVQAEKGTLAFPPPPGVPAPFGLANPVLVYDYGLRVLVGTAMLASPDGDGSTTYMIATAAMVPLYRQLGMDVRKVATVIVMAGAVMNILPWGGTTARGLGALRLNAGDMFVPLVAPMIATAGWLLLVAWRFGVIGGDRGELDRLDRVAERSDAEPRGGRGSGQAAARRRR